MNGVRSTYMRKGYLLTALAAAVLLAASSGTALAQSVGFVGTSATVGEGASCRRKHRGSNHGRNRCERTHAFWPWRQTGVTAFGTLTIEHDADLAYSGQDAVRTAAESADLGGHHQFGCRRG